MRGDTRTHKPTANKYIGLEDVSKEEKGRRCDNSYQVGKREKSDPIEGLHDQMNQNDSNETTGGNDENNDEDDENGDNNEDLGE